MRLLFTLLLWLVALPAFASSSLPVDTGRVVAQLLSDHRTVAPGQSFQVALSTRLDPKWHTYWRNPGDSGEPVQITWTLPDALTAGDIVWPRPDTIATGPIVNYGFEGTPLFPVEFTVADDAEPGTILEINASVYYLVCYDVCVPEDGELRLVVEVGEPDVNAKNSAKIEGALDIAPKPYPVRSAMEKSGETLSLEFENLPDGDFGEAYFFPYDNTVLNHSAPQEVQIVDGGLILRVPASFGWEDGFDSDQSGLLAFDLNGERTGVLVEVTPNASLGLAVAPVAAPSGSAGIGEGGAASQTTLLTAVLGALLGGLILNLMPCVFPVISLKALSLAKTAHGERTHIRGEAWAYTAGVFATFALLVGLLLILKASGEAMAWGFQLQNPIVVGALAVVLFAVGLNLLGVFEIGGGSYQNTGASLAGRGGRSGSFFTGALAVIVATPCTAPFMAGAVGYALLQPSALTIVLVFAALAAGFAAPFLLLGYAPGLLAKIPRPGPWMVRLREGLSFPMFIAAIWLTWVVGNQGGMNAAGLVLISMVLLGFALWTIRLGRVGKLVTALSLLAIFGALYSVSFFVVNALSSDRIASDGPAPGKLAAQAWSPETVAALRADGRAVFVDFTADWCVTCKANEISTLNRREVVDAFERTNTAFLIADWTNKNDLIANELASYGRAGVPLYLYFPAGDNSVRAEVLPQVLNVDMLVRVLEGSPQ